MFVYSFLCALYETISAVSNKSRACKDVVMVMLAHWAAVAAEVFLFPGQSEGSVNVW